MTRTACTCVGVTLRRRDLVLVAPVESVNTTPTGNTVDVVARALVGVWHFLVGDDWVVALGAAVVIAAERARSHECARSVVDHAALGVVFLLADSLRRAASAH